MNDEQTADNLFRILLTQEAKGLMPYAQSYAKAGIGMKGEVLRVQITYILNNLQWWKGELARDVKKKLKRIMKELNNA